MSSTQQFTCRVLKRMWVSFISPFLNIFLFWYDDTCLFWFVDVSLDVLYVSFCIQNQLDSMPTTYEEDLKIQSSLLQGTVPEGWQGATDNLEQVDTLCNIKWQSWASKISWLYNMTIQHDNLDRVETIKGQLLNVLYEIWRSTDANARNRTELSEQRISLQPLHHNLEIDNRQSRCTGYNGVLCCNNPDSISGVGITYPREIDERSDFWEYPPGTALQNRAQENSPRRAC